jgi:hypothetical protein
MITDPMIDIFLTENEKNSKDYSKPSGIPSTSTENRIQ